MEKRRNTSSKSPLPSVCRDKHPYKYLSINIVSKNKKQFWRSSYQILSFKGISCSMYLIVY